MGFDLNEKETNSTEGFVLDLTGAEAPAMEVLPKGTYEAVIDEFELTESQKGDRMIKVVYEIVDNDESISGRKLFDYIMLEGKGAAFGMPKLRQLVVAALPEADLSAFDLGKVSESGEFLQRTVSLDVKVQKQKSGDYAGQMQNRINGIKEHSGGSFI